MKSVIPILGLFVLLGCEGPETPDTAADDGTPPTGDVFGPAPASTLAPTAQDMSSPPEDGALVGAQGEGHVLRGVFNPEALRAFQATRGKTWGGVK